MCLSSSCAQSLRFPVFFLTNFGLDVTCAKVVGQSKVGSRSRGPRKEANTAILFFFRGRIMPLRKRLSFGPFCGEQCENRNHEHLKTRPQKKNNEVLVTLPTGTEKCDRGGPFFPVHFCLAKISAHIYPVFAPAANVIDCADSWMILVVFACVCWSVAFSFSIRKNRHLMQTKRQNVA